MNLDPEVVKDWTQAAAGPLIGAVCLAILWVSYKSKMRYWDTVDRQNRKKNDDED